MFLGSESTAATLPRAITARLACFAARRTSGTGSFASIWVRHAMLASMSALPHRPSPQIALIRIRPRSCPVAAIRNAMPALSSRPHASTTVLIASASGTSSAANSSSFALPTSPASVPTTDSMTSGCAPSSAWVICGIIGRMSGPSSPIASAAAAATRTSLSRSSITRSSEGWFAAASPSAAFARTTPRPSRSIATSSSASSCAA